MVYTTTKDIETWQVQKEEYKQYTEEAIILCTEGKCFSSLQKEGFIFPWSEVAKLASMLMIEKHRESSKKAASYSTLISSANHANYIYLFVSTRHIHTQIPWEREIPCPSDPSTKFHKYLVQQDPDVLNLLSFRPGTAHVTDFQGDSLTSDTDFKGHQIL